MRSCRFVAVAFITLAASIPERSWGAGRRNPVPDPEAAVSLAEKILIPIYGRKQIESERPFKARLEDHAWIVCGYLPPDMDGGVAYVWIDQLTGQILGVWHTK